MIKEIEIDNKIYLTIPSEWKDTYHKLLYVLSIVGNDIVNDCTLCCKDNISIFNYWNLFQSAIAAKTLGDEAKATFIYNYILKEVTKYISVYNITIPDIINNYPKIVYSMDDADVQTFTISSIINGQIVTKVIKLPEDISHYYYGVSNVIIPTDLNLLLLTHVTDTIAGKTLTLTTTLVNNIIWFVSPFKLKFTQGDLPVTLNETNFNGMYYYNTDALIADDNIFTVLSNK